jgi:hypothetical protein
LATVTVLGFTATEKSAGGTIADFWDELNPIQPVRHSDKETASKLASNLGEFIGPRLPQLGGYFSSV